MLKLLPLLDSSPSGVHNSNIVRSLKPYVSGGSAVAVDRNYQLLLRQPTELWRKGWDSNPRNPFEVHYISNVANSTALAPFRKSIKIKNYDLRSK